MRDKGLQRGQGDNSTGPAFWVVHVHPPVAPMTFRRGCASCAAMGPGQQIVTPTFLAQQRGTFRRCKRLVHMAWLETRHKKRACRKSSQPLPHLSQISVDSAWK